MKPNTPEIAHAIVINASDAIKRSPITLITGLRYSNDVPRSPCTTAFPQLINCCTFGSLSPQYAAIFSRCSGLTLVISAPTYDCTGSTGEKLINVKDRMLTASSNDANLIIFPKIYLVIV